MTAEKKRRGMGRRRRRGRSRHASSTPSTSPVSTSPSMQGRPVGLLLGFSAKLLKSFTTFWTVVNEISAQENFAKFLSYRDMKFRELSRKSLVIRDTKFH
jgi:hypothetical protein